jgi:hypothetical protein
MLTNPHASPLLTRDDMARAGWLIIACACFVGVILIVFLGGDYPQ